MSVDGFECPHFDLVFLSIEEQKCASSQREGRQLRETLLKHCFLFRIRVILFHKQFVQKFWIFDAGDFAKERIVVLVLCNIARVRLDILDLEFLSLRSGLYVGRWIIDPYFKLLTIAHVQIKKLLFLRGRKVVTVHLLLSHCRYKRSEALHILFCGFTSFDLLIKCLEFLYVESIISLGFKIGLSVI